MDGWMDGWMDDKLSGTRFSILVKERPLIDML